jgi:hypothetical protein
MSDFLIEYKYIIFSIVVFLLFFIINSYTFTDLFTKNYYIIGGDNASYTNTIEYLNKVKIETVISYWDNPALSNMNTYHFIELWLTASISKIFSLNPFFTFQSIYISFYYMLSILGGLVIIEKVSKTKNKYNFIIAISVIFLSGLSFYIPQNPLIIKGWDYFTPLFYKPRQCFPFAILVLISYLILEKKYKYSILIFLTLPFINIGCAPFVYITIMLFCNYAFYKFNFNIKIFIKSTAVYIPIIIFFFFYLVFVHLLGKNVIFDFTENKAAQNSIFDISYIKVAFNCFLGMSIRIIIINLFLIILLSYIGIKKKEIQTIVFGICLTLLAGNISYAIFYKLYDGIQLFYLIYTSAIAILLLILFSLLLNCDKIIYKIFIFLYIIVSLYQNIRIINRKDVDVVFVEKVLQKVKQKDAKFASIVFMNKDANVVEKNVLIFVQLPYFKYFYNNFFPTVLNSLEIPLSDSQVDKEIAKNIIPITPISIYANKYNKNIHNNDYMFDFLKDYKIEYLFVEKRASVPIKIQQAIIDSVITNNIYNFYCIDLKK